MQDSSFQTLDIAPSGTPNPTTLIKVALVPLRVLINNVGPTMVFVSCDTTALTPIPTTATYRVLAGEQHAFILAPRQSLYAISAGAGAFVSVAASEALPN